MAKDEDSVVDDLAAGAAGLALPVIGQALGKRLSRSIRREWKRNASKAVQAAERAAGMSREDLAEAIEANPELIPLTTRVLFAAGMTGRDETLALLGNALGNAIRDPGKIDEVELLLVATEGLRTQHVRILHLIGKEQPFDLGSSWWNWQTLGVATGYRPEIVASSTRMLLGAGLLREMDRPGGTAYTLTPLGESALEVIQGVTEHGAAEVHLPTAPKTETP